MNLPYPPRLVEGIRQKPLLLTSQIFELYMGALMKLPHPPIETGTFNMISITGKGKNTYSPELFQISHDFYENEYIFTHFEVGTHKILQDFVINPMTFQLDNSFYNRGYTIELLYGEYRVDPNKIF
jgi:hypothetical protein